MRYFKILKYSAAYTIPASACIAFAFSNIWSFLTPVYAFICLPLLEQFLPVSTKNMSSMEEEISKQDPFYDLLLYLNVPIQFGVLCFFLYTLSAHHFTWWEHVGMTISMGTCCGVLGINVAHELGHRKNEFDRTLAKLLLLSSLYMHFIIEHNKGHHKNVSTDNDPASAKFGENIYTFFIRTIVFSYISAWHIQKKELQSSGATFLSFKNQMIWFVVFQILFISTIGFIFSIQALLFFIAAACIGILLLEAVNYIEHYGLRRSRSAAGSYERVMPWHSWNSDYYIGRIVLYELTRHSDHHYMASRKYQVLRHMEEAPQLPAGYPGMIVISLIPPLFFKIMNPKVIAIQSKHYTNTL